MVFLVIDNNSEPELGNRESFHVDLLGVYTTEEAAEKRLEFLNSNIDDDGYRTDTPFAIKSHYEIIYVDLNEDMEQTLGFC